MSKKLKVSVGQCTNRGRKPHNQDFQDVRVPTNNQLALKGVAAATADGISSSDVSHIASEVAVKNFLDDYYCTSETWSIKTSVETVLQAANSWLYSQTKRSPYRYDKDKGYVCTFSAVLIKNRHAHVFHIGDTRVYRLNKNGLEQLTNDHRVWDTQDHSYLSRALGIEEQCSLDYQALAVHIGDAFIVATDGVYEFIDATSIIDIIHQNANLQTAAEFIVQTAIEQGSDDNLSIQILRVNELPEQTGSEVKQQIDELPLPPELHARMTFDGYTILREIHSSARSHVYLAQDTITQKKVVLKTLATELASDAASLERFLLEEWVARRMNNPHVLKVDLPDRKRNHLYTLFEFIEGQTLAQWALDNPKPKMQAVRDIVEQIAKGLNAFHRLEMLHQDLRPENIMIDTEGTVKIIDFGSVSIAGLEEAKTETPSTYLMGTALYSAPEYFLGEPGSARSDIFSLGVIAYFLLSGRYPYGTDAAKTKTLSAQRKLYYRSVLDDDSETPAWVDSALHKAVQPLPFKRYEALFEFVHDLREPNKMYLNKTRPPLIERNPVAFWQGVSLILVVVIVYLLNR